MWGQAMSSGSVLCHRPRQASSSLASVHFDERIGGVGDAQSVSDSFGQKSCEGRDTSDASGLRRAGMGNSQVKWIVPASADGAIGIDAETGVNAFGGDDDVGEVVFGENGEVFLQFIEHEGNHRGWPICLRVGQALVLAGLCPSVRRCCLH